MELLFEPGPPGFGFSCGLVFVIALVSKHSGVCLVFFSSLFEAKCPPFYVRSIGPAKRFSKIGSFSLIEKIDAG